MITDEIRAKASTIAEKYGLPARLVMAIITVESGGNPAATRFEPLFLERYIKPLNFPEQEARDRSTSWGLMQIMGQTAYTIGFRGKFSDLLNPRVGLEWGCAYIRRLACRYPDEPWEVICRAYNGGPGNRHSASNTYPAKVLKHLGEWPARESTLCVK